MLVILLNFFLLEAMKFYILLQAKLAYASSNYEIVCLHCEIHGCRKILVLIAGQYKLNELQVMFFMKRMKLGQILVW